MDTLAKSDIFFLITSIAVVIVTALLAVALIYAISILREAKKISAAVKDESAAVIADIAEARRFVRKEGMKFGTLVGLAGRFIKGTHRRKAHVKKAESDGGNGDE